LGWKELLKVDIKERVKCEIAIIKQNKPYTTTWPNIGNPEMEICLTQMA